MSEENQRPIFIKVGDRFINVREVARWEVNDRGDIEVTVRTSEFGFETSFVSAQDSGRVLDTLASWC